MDTHRFWKLIDSSREAAQGIARKQVDILTGYLRDMGAADIVEFDRIYQECLSRLNCWPIHGVAMIEGWADSPDAFMDFKGWLISRGQWLMDTVLADPDVLVEAPGADPAEQWVFEFNDVPARIVEELTGQPSPISPADCAEPLTGEPIDITPAELSRRYPKLSARFRPPGKRPWNYGLVLTAFVAGLVFQNIMLPCLCHEGTIGMRMAATFDVLILTRIVVAYCIKEKGRGWIFYLVLCLISAPAISLLIALA